MEIRKIVTPIGNISVGKSTILNYLMGADILQTGGSLKTRAIIIIRNSEISEPVLSHIKKVKGSDKSVYIKDEIDPESGKPIEIKGELAVKKKIEELNQSLEEVQGMNSVHDYESHIYMLEIKFKNIDNEDFLITYDFADIPGLNSIKTAKNSNGDMDEIFLPFQGLISFGILIFDATQYLDQTAIEIIKTITDSKKKLIASDDVKPDGQIKMKNFLIILNKIEEIPEKDREYIVEDFKAYLLNKLGSDALSDENSIIPMDCHSLKKEVESYESFEKFLIFNLEKFLSSGIGMTPIDYLKNEICYSYYMNHKFEKRKTYSAVSQILSAENDEELSQELKYKIESCISFVNRKYGKSIKIDLDDEDDENVAQTVKLFNIIYRLISSNKKEQFFVPHPHKYRTALNKYFNKFSKKSSIGEMPVANGMEEHEITDTGSVDQNLFKSVSILREFYENKIKNKVDKNLQEQFDEDISRLENSLKNLDKVRIAVWGNYSTGKSTTLNNIIGKDLLQVKNAQCTAKPILIRYADSDIPKIYKSKFEVIKDNFCKVHYHFTTTGEPLAKGDDAVRDFINSQNHLQGKRDTVEDPQEFYILETRIKLLDELNIPGAKETVEFIDLPGGNATIPKDGAFENMIHRTVVFLVIYETSSTGIETESFNKEMNFLRDSRFMLNCKGDDITAPYLFVCNKFDKNPEFDYNKTQKILNQIFDTKDKQFSITRYSAKHGEILRNNGVKYSPETYIEEGFLEFIQTLHNKKHSFLEFLAKKIKKEVEVEFFRKYEIEKKENPLLFNQIKDILLSNGFLDESNACNKENVDLIKQISFNLQFIQRNITTLNKINIEVDFEFKKAIAKKIEYGLYYLRDGYKNNIEKVIQNFHLFFRLGIVGSNKQKVSEECKKKCQELMEDLTKIFQEYDIPSFVNDFYWEIHHFMRDESGINWNEYEDEIKRKNQELVRRNERFGRELNSKCESFSRKLMAKVNEVDSMTAQYFSVANNVDIESTAPEILKSIGYATLGGALTLAGGIILAPFVLVSGLIAVSPEAGAGIVLCIGIAAALEYGIGAVLAASGIGVIVGGIGVGLIFLAKIPLAL